MTHPDIPLPPDPPKKRIRRPLQESGGLDFHMAFELPMVPEVLPAPPPDPEDFQPPR